MNKELSQMHNQLRERPLLVVKKLADMGSSLRPSYHPRFSLDALKELSIIISELDSVNLPESCDMADMDDAMFELMQEVFAEVKEFRETLKEVMLFYKHEPKHNYGNRLLQLSDILIASFQTGLSTEEIEKVFCMVEIELHKISLEIGGDY